MGKKYKVVFDRKGCIGALACVATYEKRWTLANDGKVDLQGGSADPASGDEHFVLWIDEDELPKMKEAAEVCPVTVIHIYDEQGTQIL